MPGREDYPDIDPRPVWLLALIPLLGVVWGVWYVVKHLI